MKFNEKIRTAAAAKSRPPGFTLVEILVALALMAIIVPVIGEGLKLASLAGEVSQRKALAMRIAERVLNETIITGQWNQVGHGGDEKAGNVTFHWSMQNDPWNALNSLPSVNSTPNGINTTVVNPNTLHVLTADVTFPAQGRNFGVHLSTVIDITKQVNANTPPTQ